ncbi:cell filamentation protein Fic [Caenimonas koreensis DSM 17982]|uniref:Cell filamentation protein Fic n=1 Tax=Caenimonas koreensis DSM 17982 TaxID=1121255 RepID=A0A844ASL6_9BURK|nr:Fic family protein [Caenimonas koreensis]MRD47315.1 cell filamentation protein Fic [Caenimonas koreensis DSM 17982]
MKQKTTHDESLVLYAELSAADIRTIQRRMKDGAFERVLPGVVSSRPAQEWPELVARNRIRVLAALFPGAVVGFKSAFMGGAPVGGIFHLTHTWRRKVELPGMTVQTHVGPPAVHGDAPMMGRNLFFPSQSRVLLENLVRSRGENAKSAGQGAVEKRLIEICDARGQEALNRLREEARELAPILDMAREFAHLEGIIGGILGTRKTQMASVEGKAMAARIPYDSKRLELFERLAAELRATPLKQPAAALKTERARNHFAFLESYFSNFIEGTEFDVSEARGFVLEGKPITERPKDSHDILGVFRQAINRGWANQTLAVGESIQEQLRARHADQMKERPEVNPGEFKTAANRAGNTEFVQPRLVRGTLVEGSRLLPTVPEGTARALLAMFLISEVHPFTDGNGRLARLVMNAELSVAGSCRIIVPTLFREEYLDCLRTLTRAADPVPYMNAMQRIHEWTAAFDYEDLDGVIDVMTKCNAFERSPIQYKLLWPSQLAPQPAASGPGN